MNLPKMGQAKHMGKWEAATAMLRLVRALEARLEDAGTPADHEEIDNVYYTYLATLPEKVREEVREG